MRHAEEYQKYGDFHAFNFLVTCNMRLVVQQVRAYQRLSRRRLPFMDLVNAGKIGLHRAAEKFDYSKGYQLSTYASHWIFQAINHYVAETRRIVRIPEHIQDQGKQVTKVMHNLTAQGIEDPITQTAEALGMTGDKVNQLIAYTKTSEVSIDAPIGEDSDRTIQDYLASGDPTAETSLTEAKPTLQLAAIIAQAHLKERELTIIKCRWGLDDQPQATLEELASRLGISCERVRQLEIRAMNKLKKQRLRTAA